MRILIVGAGISGLSMAIALEKSGFEFRIIEKSSSLSFDGAGIALPFNAVDALEFLGLKDDLLKIAHTVNSITYSLPTGEKLSTAILSEHFPENKKFVSIHRKDLILLLASKLKTKIEFSKQISDIEADDNVSRVKFVNKSAVSSSLSDDEYSEFDFVIGADGIHSRLRSHFFQSEQKEDLGNSTWRFVANFMQAEPEYFFGKKSAFMIYPLSNTQVYCYAHVHDPKKEARSTISYMSQVFGEYPSKVNWLIQSANQKDIIFGRLLTLVKPTLSKSNVVFIGDAAHACSPMLQQGAASAFEDSIAISRFLTEFEDIQTVIEHYNQFRMPRIEWVRENSDTPLKRISACITDDDYKIRNRFIVENGPTNVSKWKILSGESFIDSMNSYLSKIRSINTFFLQ